MTTHDPLGVTETIRWGTETATIYRVDRLKGVVAARLARRPRTVRVLLENIVRHFDPAKTDLAEVVALANGSGGSEEAELAYYPERVLLRGLHRCSRGGRPLHPAQRGRGPWGLPGAD